MKGEEKLLTLRKIMKERGYDVYIIPHGDQHDNEYIAEKDERIKFISNFSGSYGLGLVTQNVAIMWTDPRYFIQIENELYPGWKMGKMKNIYGDEDSLPDYIINNIPKKSNIGMDFSLFTKGYATKLKNKLSDYNFLDDINNIIDNIWGKEKPKLNSQKVLILPEKYAGCKVYDKYKMIDIALKNANGNLNELNNYRLLISRLDDIAWLLNLRGKDIPFNPVFFCYALFCKNIKNEFFTKLFINKNKVDSPEIIKYCEENKIKIFEYEELFEELENNNDKNLITFCDNLSTNYRIYEKITNLKKGKSIFLNTDIIEEIKSVKNKIEIEGFKKSNLKDSVSLIKFFSWLEDELTIKNRTDLNEYELCLKNKECREDQEDFIGESFSPIIAGGSNAAIMHYEPNERLNSNVNKNLIILCDTGAQYKHGTTDITRTVHFGKPTKKEKEMYTRVLLGNLCLERIIFEKGKNMHDFENIPRIFLKMIGEDYAHDTTHGVGHFLNVHEGPYFMTLKEGNIITNEPGYYEKNNFGIRIENEMLVVKKDEDHLAFENLTFLPYEKNLIDVTLISEDFKNYINNFHKQCFDKLSPLLENDSKALDYLKRKTEPI
jgi:Xaa-Pro aminopeptidase